MVHDINATWRRFRDEFPVTRNWAYFDNAAVAPLSRPSQAAIARWSEEALHHGDTLWPAWRTRIEEIRQTVARSIGAAPTEIAFVANTSSGIGLVAEGFPWQSGDNLIIPDNEFPSNVYPWLHLASRGVETRRVPTSGSEIDLDRLAAEIDDRTRLISISWVGYATGYRIDLAEIVELAHARNVLVLVDAIQGMGVFPLDVSQIGVDFLAADGHKWMLGPEGAGVFYLKKQHLDLLRPIQIGWNSVVHSSDYLKLDLDLQPTAVRYEGGTANTPGILGLGASLDLLVEFGWSAASSTIAERVLAVTSAACRRLEEIGAKIVSNREPQHQSGIVAFDIPGASPNLLRSRCHEAGIALSCRGGHLRISPHAYNSEDDIERLVQTIVENRGSESNGNRSAS